MGKQKWILGGDDEYIRGIAAPHDIRRQWCRLVYTFDRRLALRFATREEAIEFRDKHAEAKNFGPRPENLG